MSSLMLINTFKTKEKVIFFPLFLCMNFFFSQTILRNSDNAKFDSLTIINNKGGKKILNKKNFKSYIFSFDDKVLNNNKQLDFAFFNDTLVFFDKTKEIEEVQMVKVDIHNKKENAFKSGKVNAVATLPSNNWNGTLIKINQTKRRAYIKSIILFPEAIYDNTGKIEVQIIENINGLPNNDNLIYTFEKNFSDAKKNKWEIELPRIVRYPNNGFFLILYYKTEKKTEKMLLKLTSNSSMYYYYPSQNEWKKMSFNGFLYKLKVLQ